MKSNTDNNNKGRQIQICIPTTHPPPLCKMYTLALVHAVLFWGWGRVRKEEEVLNTLFKVAGPPLGNMNTIPEKDASFAQVLFRTPKVLCVRVVLVDKLY